jgi:hypothetical protein
MSSTTTTGALLDDARLFTLILKVQGTSLPVCPICRDPRNLTDQQNIPRSSENEERDLEIILRKECVGCESKKIIPA